jgi:hypothetical protein
MCTIVYARYDWIKKVKEGKENNKIKVLKNELDRLRD